MSREHWKLTAITHPVEAFIPTFHVTGTHKIGLDGGGAEKEIGNGSSQLVGFLDVDYSVQKSPRTLSSVCVGDGVPSVPPETSQIFPSGLA